MAHNLFGSTSPYSIPVFNLDKGWHPDQQADNAPTECTGYTVAKILTDYTGIQRDPDWHYAAARYIEGVGPGIDGADIHAAMLGAVGVGSLPETSAMLSSSHNGELTISDWTNWTPEQKVEALKHVENGVANALGNGEPFDSILSAAYTAQMGVSIGTPFFAEWVAASLPTVDVTGHSTPGTGIMPMPNLSNLPSIWHDWVILGKDQTYKSEYAIAYVHQGDEKWGDKGLNYYDRDTINAVMNIRGTGALIFNPSADRFYSLIGIILTRFPLAAPLAPELLRAFSYK